MNTWSLFPLTCIVVCACWSISVLLLLKGKQKPVFLWAIFGWSVLAIFIGLLWWSLRRPPLRTLGETRLWYAVGLPLCALLITWRWKMKWPLIYALAISSVFLGITLLRPESHDKTLMPALQSVWFVPHVVVYIMAYAFLTAASVSGAQGLWQHRRKQSTLVTIQMADSLAWIGLALLTMGLLFGALWAKQAWGHYWTWDPKETWAFLTWVAYLSYIHIRFQHPQKHGLACAFLVIACVVLFLCWFGVNAMPSANQSVHTYTR